MRHTYRWSLMVTLTACISVAVAQSNGGSFAITHSSIDPASPAMTGGAFSVTATVGQSATAALGAGTYELTGGFNAAASGDGIFGNGFEP